MKDFVTKEHFVHELFWIKLKECEGHKKCMYIKATSDAELQENDWEFIQNTFDVFAQYGDTYCVIIDIRKMTSLSMTYVSNWVEFFKKNKTFLKQHTSCILYVSDNKLLQGIINMSLKFYKPIVPVHIIENTDDLTKFYEKKYFDQKNVCVLSNRS